MDGAPGRRRLDLAAHPDGARKESASGRRVRITDMWQGHGR